MLKPPVLILKVYKKKKVFSGLLAGLIGIPMIIGGASFYYKATHPLVPESPQVKAERDYNVAVKKRQEMLATAKKQVQLPVNEDPVLATVSDKNTLPKEEFFKDAQNGDKILMYPKNKKIFLYRPSNKQVLAQAPLDYTVGQSSTQSAAVSGVSSENTEPPVTTPTVLPTLPPHGKILIQQ